MERIWSYIRIIHITKIENSMILLAILEHSYGRVMTSDEDGEMFDGKD